MCWSGEASAVLATAGIAGAAYSALKKDPEPLALWVCLLYFASMESLQAVAYSVLNQCDSPLNQLMTMFGYLHITFQPFFINAVALYFMPKDSARIIAPWAYFGCFVAAIAMLLQLYPFAWAGHCAARTTALRRHALHGARRMAHRLAAADEWHWQFHGQQSLSRTRLHRISADGLLHPIALRQLALILFSWLAGPFLAGLTTSNINEWPAVWCLFSIGLVLAIIKTPLRYHLHVGDPWWMMLIKWWKRRKAAAKAALAAARPPAEPVALLTEVKEPAE